MLRVRSLWWIQRALDLGTVLAHCWPEVTAESDLAPQGTMNPKLSRTTTAFSVSELHALVNCTKILGQQGFNS